MFSPSGLWTYKENRMWTLIQSRAELAIGIPLPRSVGPLADRNTSKCCLSSPCSAGWAPADRLRPSALMTYRLERRGIHVSGQCHGPAAKTVGVGAKESRRLLPVLSDGGLAPGLCHITLPPNRPQMKDVKSKRGEEGRWRGTLQLKRLSSCKLKRHYLLTWQCPLWGCTLWCENTEGEKEKVCTVASAANNIDNCLLAWFWNIISSFSVSEE